MHQTLKALIFDMDGVLINSEQLWRRAMIKGFSEFGMRVTEEECRKTMGLRISEVIQLWIGHFKREIALQKDIEQRIVDLLLDLIGHEGAYIDGIPEIIGFCEQKKIPMGIATSSSTKLLQAVMKKLEIVDKIQAGVSAENLKYGKPHPEVFLRCAEKLNLDPKQCLVIEDSVNGIVAAKAAQMQVIAVPDEEHGDLKQFALADHRFNNMKEVLPLLKSVFS